jgi:ABC-type branched-subunit amino acid transport system ATPase component
MTSPHTQSNVLQADEIVVRFGGLTALDRVSLAIPPAAIVGLVGPNGAGKSTLFSVCSGLLRASSGRVVLSGRDVTGATPQARARLGLARTFQQPELFMGLTARQHLTLAYRARQSPRRLWTDMFTLAALRPPGARESGRVTALLDLLGLVDFADTLVDAMPLGIARRVEVGRALATSPRLLLLDEPFSGLDAAESAQLCEALQRTAKDEGISLLLVEHDVAMVLSLCSLIYVLDFGKMLAHGSPDEIRADEAVRAAYLGDDPAPAEVHPAEVHPAAAHAAPEAPSPR